MIYNESLKRFFNTSRRPEASGEKSFGTQSNSTLLIDPFIPSNMNFLTILMTKVILSKILSENSWSVRTILILSILYITLLFQCLLGGLDLTGGRYDSPEHHLYQTLLEEHLGDFRNSNAPSVPPEEGKVQFSL